MTQIARFRDAVTGIRTFLATFALLAMSWHLGWIAVHNGSLEGVELVWYMLGSGTAVGVTHAGVGFGKMIQRNRGG